MAKKTVTTTPNPLDPLQQESLGLDVDQQKWFLEMLKTVGPSVITAMQSGTGGLDYADEVFRSMGTYSDQASAAARGGGPSGEAQLRQLYQEKLGRPADEAGLSYWLNSGKSIDEIARTFDAVAAAGTDPLKPQSQGGMGLAPPAPDAQLTTYQPTPFDPNAGQDRITAIEDAAITAGQKNIDRFALDALRVMREELAPQLGMRSRDTPVLDRGGRLMEDVTRQKADLAEGVYSQGAQLRLDYPLKQYQTLSDVGVNEGRLDLDNRSLAETARQFNSGFDLSNRTLNAEVLQRGIDNRLAGANALMNRYNFGVNSGLNLLQAGRPNQINFPGTGETQTGKTSSTSSKLSNAGQIISAAGTVAGAFGFSSRELKDVLEDISPAKALQGVAGTPVSKWVYKGDPVEHIGPMAEDFQKAFGVGDGVTIHFIDAIGVLFAAVQALDQKQKEMTHAN